MITSLARPRIANKLQEITGKGIDIVLAIDTSGSMKAVDFKPTNRLESAKKVAQNFISERQNDRIGIISFAETAFTQCPLTLDYNILMQIMDLVEIDEEAKGTAIGMGLATAVGRLRSSKAKSKVIILITDGRNNAGEIDPRTAAELAATYGIKVYTVGVGKKGLVDFPVQHPIYGLQYQKMQSDIDMETLDMIAKVTGTERARRATSSNELKQIIQRINELETTELKIKNYYEYKDLFGQFLLIAMLLLIFEFIVRIVLRKEIP